MPKSTSSLKGKRIVLTKSIRDKDEIRDALEVAEATVLQMPLIEVDEIDDKDQTLEIFKGIATYDWIVLTSVNGVKYFFEKLLNAFKDIRAFGPSRIACVGHQTAAAVKEYHLEIDLVPEDTTGLGLAKALVDTGSLPSAYVLWVSGDKINKEAVDLLQGEGEAIVDVFEVYKTSLRNLDNDEVATEFRKKGADGILFASASAAESFVKQAKQLKRGKSSTAPKTVSIGPSTSVAMKSNFIPIDREAASPAAIDVVAAFKVLLG